MIAAITFLNASSLSLPTSVSIKELLAVKSFPGLTSLTLCKEPVSKSLLETWIATGSAYELPVI